MKNNIDALVAQYMLQKKQNKDLDKSTNDIIRAFDPFIRTKALTFFNIEGVSSDDFIQEGRLGLLNALKNFNEEKNISFSTFATTCINNAMLDLARKQANNTNKVISEAIPLESIPQDVPARSETAEDMAIFHELENNIKKQLNEYQYKVFDLYRSGYSYEQIAKECNKSKKDIDNCIQIIKKKIRFLF